MGFQQKTSIQCVPLDQCQPRPFLVWTNRPRPFPGAQEERYPCEQQRSALNNPLCWPAQWHWLRDRDATILLRWYPCHERRCKSDLHPCCGSNMGTSVSGDWPCPGWSPWQPPLRLPACSAAATSGKQCILWGWSKSGHYLPPVEYRQVIHKKDMLYFTGKYWLNIYSCCSDWPEQILRTDWSWAGQWTTAPHHICNHLLLACWYQWWLDRCNYRYENHIRHTCTFDI